jgi:hypothetical protein
MMSLTEAWIEYDLGVDRRRLRARALVVNRQQLD